LVVNFIECARIRSEPNRRNPRPNPISSDTSCGCCFLTTLFGLVTGGGGILIILVVVLVIVYAVLAVYSGKKFSQFAQRKFPGEKVFNTCPVCGNGTVFKFKKPVFWPMQITIPCCNYCNAEFSPIRGSNSYTCFNYELRNETLELPVILNAGERVSYIDNVRFSEERAVRDYISGRTGLRIAKGVWVGGSKGRAESHGELREIDRGLFLLTTQRIFFKGNLRKFEFDFSDITSMEPSEDGIEIGVKNKSKLMVFSLTASQRFLSHFQSFVNV
jgi:hypothetical protein